jgi:hypothetical protein
LKHLLIIILSLLFFPILSFGQLERPETIIVPVSSLGDVSEVRKQILHNTLTNELKKHFRIVPQEKYEQVLEQVFEELEYEECSEDTCIMRVQEMLQVENVFNLQVIGEGNDSQLNLKWITLDEKKNEEDYCKGCGTFELREMIGGLVEKLVGEEKNNQQTIDSSKNNQQNTTSTIQSSNYNTSSFGISFIYPMQYPSQEKNVKGLRISLFGAYNENVEGLDMTFIGISGTKKSKGGQIIGGGLNFTNEMDGMQAVGIGINYSSTFSTYQIAGVGINYAENTTIQIGMSLNVASKSSTQIGFVNYSEKTNFQVGFLNITKYLDGIQIGFLNIVLKPTAPYGYVLPFFNMSF